MSSRIEYAHDPLNHTVTITVGSQRVTVERRTFDEVGAERVLREYGLEAPTGRLPVHRNGKKIGTVPATFEPTLIKSTSFFYDPRPGDFVWSQDKWIAANNLGPGDFDAVPGFEWDRDN